MNTTQTETPRTETMNLGAYTPSFRRTDYTDPDCSEVLTLVRINGLSGDDSLAVQITTGPDVGDDLVGLYDVDGDRLDLGNCTWDCTRESDVSTARAAEIFADWETGSYQVEQIREVV